VTLDLGTLPLVLGGNVFGWTADRDASYAVLDAFTGAGGRMVDTADVYSAWADGNSGGESERLIGQWLSDRGRDRLVVATKVAKHPDRPGLAPDNVARACEESLQRLGTDRIDLYYAHEDDERVPLEDTWRAFDALVRDGRVGALGLSNYSPERVRAVVETCRREGLTVPVVLQQEYNLVARGYEGALRDAVRDTGLTTLPYAGLASGFLTGKYRGQASDSPRSGKAERLHDERGQRVLAALDAVAAETGAAVATVALAWLLSQPTVSAPIASARSAEQLADLLAVGSVQLTDDQLSRLADAGA
jgi:aryl-alcohol dehydrogenase-like predicted oxidoreductase